MRFFQRSGRRSFFSQITDNDHHFVFFHRNDPAFAKRDFVIDRQIIFNRLHRLLRQGRFDQLHEPVGQCGRN